MVFLVVHFSLSQLFTHKFYMPIILYMLCADQGTLTLYRKEGGDSFYEWDREFWELCADSDADLLCVENIVPEGLKYVYFPINVHEWEGNEFAPKRRMALLVPGEERWEQMAGGHSQHVASEVRDEEQESSSGGIEENRRGIPFGSSDGEGMAEDQESSSETMVISEDSQVGQEALSDPDWVNTVLASRPRTESVIPVGCDICRYTSVRWCECNQ